MPVQVQALDAGLDFSALRRFDVRRYPLLLVSSATGLADSACQHARWDMLLIGDGSGIVLDAEGRLADTHGRALSGGFLQALEATWQAQRLPHQHTGLPFVGGWALFLGYELAAEIEPRLRLPRAAGQLPQALALRCAAAVVRDRDSGSVHLVYESATHTLRDAVLADIARLAELPPLPAWQPAQILQEENDAQFLHGVAAVQEYLAAGDVFQANLSRSWQARFATPLDPASLQQRLNAVNPAPFSGVFAQPDWAVVSASPERLVSIAGNTVQTRPIAGTRPRFAGDDDSARIRELVGHPKEQAEHIMLVDLERNDLSRVCEAGTVEVDELMTVESYAHVHHIVSNVRGVRRPDASPVDVIRAVFPGGTITGAPKVRCMEIIAEQEGIGRGAYTGAMGWLGRDGDMDLNILIRSAEVEGNCLRFRTGAGIVLDSVAEKELAETRAKARGMLRALGVDD